MVRDTSFSPFGGANPRGWTAVLNDLGIGPYRLVSSPKPSVPPIDRSAW